MTEVLGIGYFLVFASGSNVRADDGRIRQAFVAYRHVRDLSYLLLSRGRPQKKMEMLGKAIEGGSSLFAGSPLASSWGTGFEMVA